MPTTSDNFRVRRKRNAPRPRFTPSTAELERQVRGKEYFCGDVSVADIAIFMTLLFAMRLKGPGLAGHPTLAAWFERAGARPAFARAAGELAAADRELSSL